VCQLRPLVFSLGLNNTPRISFKLVKSLFKNIWQFKQGASRCKMAGAGFHSIANLRALIPRTATTILCPWQSAIQCSADCQSPLSGLVRTLRAFQAFGIPLSNSDSWLWQSAVWQFSLWQSAWKTPRSANTGLKIWARSLAIEWNPVTGAFYIERPPVWTVIYFWRATFTNLKLIHGTFFRHKIYTNGLSLYTISWYYTFNHQRLPNCYFYSTVPGI
jgi:hypothetical protein